MQYRKIVMTLVFFFLFSFKRREHSVDRTEARAYVYILIVLGKYI